MADGIEILSSTKNKYKWVFVDKIGTHEAIFFLAKHLGVHIWRPSVAGGKLVFTGIAWKLYESIISDSEQYSEFIAEKKRDRR